MNQQNQIGVDNHASINQINQQNQFLQHPSIQKLQSQPYRQYGISLPVAIQALQFIKQSFYQQLRTNKLLINIPQFNAYKLDALNKQFVAYFYLQGESKSNKSNIQQDHMPKSSVIDNITNFHIKIQQDQLINLDQSKQFVNTKDLDHKIQQNLSLNYSLSKSQQQDHAILNNTKDNQLTNNFNVSSNQVREFLDSSANLNQNSIIKQKSKNINQSNLFPLPEKRQERDIELQNQLQRVKKNLYVMRRYRKKNLQQERQKSQMLAKRRSPIFFNKNLDHTYQYDGSTLEIKKLGDVSALIQQSKPNISKNSSFKGRSNMKSLNKSLKQSTNLTSSQMTGYINSAVENISQKIQDNNPQRKLSSQQIKKLSFNNGNKRQVSHLPFISLKQNTKIIQNKRQLAGSVTLRNSLNKSKISLENGDNLKFKSFSQIQLEKRLEKTRQKALQFTQNESMNFQNIDIMPPTLNLKQDSQPVRKQSKMMQKYLKKLTQKKSNIQKWVSQDKGLLSQNFQQLKVPQKYPIQRYYEYDYQGQRQTYQQEITSKISSKRHSIVSGMEFN